MLFGQSQSILGRLRGPPEEGTSPDDQLPSHGCFTNSFHGSHSKIFQRYLASPCLRHLPRTIRQITSCLTLVEFRIHQIKAFGVHLGKASRIPVALLIFFSAKTADFDPNVAFVSDTCLPAIMRSKTLSPDGNIGNIFQVERYRSA